MPLAKQDMRNPPREIPTGTQWGRGTRAQPAAQSSARPKAPAIPSPARAAVQSDAGRGMNRNSRAVAIAAARTDARAVLRSISHVHERGQRRPSTTGTR